MKKISVLGVVSESGQRVHEERYQVTESEDSEVTVRYSYDYQNGESPRVVIFQILTSDQLISAGKQTSGNYSISGLNISNFNPLYYPIYEEIEKACETLCPAIKPIVIK